MPWCLIWLIQNDAKKMKMTESLANWYSSERSRQELSNEYQHDRVKMFFRNLCVLILWTKVASALDGLTLDICKIQQLDTIVQCQYLCILEYTIQAPIKAPLTPPPPLPHDFATHIIQGSILGTRSSITSEIDCIIELDF